MHFSCKISNAVLNLLEEQGEDLSHLYEQSQWSTELLRDPSYWISAPDMENFLESVLRLSLKKDGPVLERAGHTGPELHAWGVLDSVLKMMPRPQEIFHQPEHFLSYFISPKPPIDNLRRTEESVAFDLPLPAEQYPLVTSYLKAALESLPIYVGQPAAKCEWTDIHLKLTWPKQQSTIFAQDPGRQVSPDLFQKLIEDLQNTQREREDLQKYIGDLEEKIRHYEKLSLQAAGGVANAATAGAGDKPALLPSEGSLSHLQFESESPSYVLGQNLARLHDYMVRAQQLITMLASQGKMTPPVKEAMRRVDWDFVKGQYPRTILESMEVLKKMPKTALKEGSAHVSNS